MEIKIVYHNEDAKKNQIEKAVKILNASQNYFSFKLMSTISNVCEEDTLNWDSFCKLYSNRNSSEYIIYITEKIFDDNWFSHEER
jgi:hypothetical protein